MRDALEAVAGEDDMVRKVLDIGSTGTFSKTITESDIGTFAGITGDFNPIHIDTVAAGQSDFGQRVAHGMLTGSLISAVLGNRMPGEGSVYLEQNLKFTAPVFIGDTCTAKVRVSEILNADKGIYKLDTQVIRQDGTVVLKGYAVVKYL